MGEIGGPCFQQTKPDQRPKPKLQHSLSCVELCKQIQKVDLKGDQELGNRCGMRIEEIKVDGFDMCIMYAHEEITLNPTNTSSQYAIK